MHNQPNAHVDIMTGGALMHGGLLNSAWSPASASSRDSDFISCRAMNWASQTPLYSLGPRERVTEAAEPSDPTTQVYDQLVALKVTTSTLAMHLDSAWRAGLFRQLDFLLDPDEWDFSDELPNLASFRTFLRLMIALGTVKRPSLGATANGDLIAAWIAGSDRLTVECLADDQVRWVLSETVGGDRISAAGRNPSHLLRGYLNPHNPGKWFDS